MKLGNYDQMKPLSKLASDEDIIHADTATLKLDNRKNGWKLVCVHQHANGGKFMCGACSIGRCYCYIREASGSDWTIWLSAYWDKRNNYCDITDEDIHQNVKFVTTELDYFGTQGIPMDNVDTHSLRRGGAMALALSE